MKPSRLRPLPEPDQTLSSISKYPLQEKNCRRPAGRAAVGGYRDRLGETRNDPPKCLSAAPVWPDIDLRLAKTFADTESAPIIASGLQRQLAFSQGMYGVDVFALHQIVPTRGEADKRSGLSVQRVDMFLQAISLRIIVFVRLLKHVNCIRLAGEGDLPIPKLKDSSQSCPNVFRIYSRRINCGVHSRDDRATRFPIGQRVYHRRIEEDR